MLDFLTASGTNRRTGRAPRCAADCCADILVLRPTSGTWSKVLSAPVSVASAATPISAAAHPRIERRMIIRSPARFQLPVKPSPSPVANDRHGERIIALLDVPVSGDRHAQPIGFEPRERRRESTVSELRADSEPWRARERQLAAAEHAKSHAVVRRGLHGSGRRNLQRLVTDAQHGPDVRTEPDVIGDAIEQRVHHSGLDPDRRHAAGGNVTRHRISRERELNPEMIVAPRARGRTKAAP